MKAQNFELVSVYLPPDYSIKEIAEKLGVNFTKGIEATYYASFDQERWLFFCQFDVLTFFNWSQQEIIETLKTLNVQYGSKFEKSLITQDYHVQIDANLDRPFVVKNDAIAVREINNENLIVTALVVAQSVGLERFEIEVDEYYNLGRDLLENAGRYSWLQRKKFSDYAKQISLIRHDMVLDLMLLDKPEMLWNDQQLEALYNELSEQLELQARFDVISFKLNTLKEDIAMMMDLYHHKHSSFLEWIIIILIVIEVIMGFGEHFHWF